MDGFVIEHVRLARTVPWKRGFELVDAHLSAMGRPRTALCSIALRSPKPMSFSGFKEFNAGYRDVLKSWELMVDGINPVARTNVAPEVDPPAEPSLYSFAYATPGTRTLPSFVVSGAGELPDGSSDLADVIRAGETSGEGMAAKARFVLGLIEQRMESLGVSWEHVHVTNIYTVHDLNALLSTVLLPRMGRAGEHGATWYYSRPPIVSLEFEVDVRGGTREAIIKGA